MRLAIYGSILAKIRERLRGVSKDLYLRQALLDTSAIDRERARRYNLRPGLHK